MTLKSAIRAAEKKAGVKGSRDSGRDFEKALIETHDYYASRGLAKVDKYPTPYRVVRGELIRLQSIVDFTGTLKGGRSVAIEAKSHDEHGPWPLGKIEQHQVDYLRDIDNLQGLAFVLIEQVPDGVVYLIPAKDMAERWDRAQWGGPKQISLADLRRFPRVEPGAAGPVDWYPVAVRMVEGKANGE